MFEFLKKLFGWKKELGMDELSRRLGINAHELKDLVPSYREAFIPKKSGPPRRLLVPDDKLKALQRLILQKLLRRLRAHPAAKGFERGLSIVDNAAPHVGKYVIIKMDVVDFFPSCKADVVTAYFRKIGWDKTVAALLTNICTHEGCLPQGAPTSPRLSNLVHWPLDARIQRRVSRCNGSYTRYADDITISFFKGFPSSPGTIINYVRSIARSSGLKIHKKGKLRVVRNNCQQRVTGLVVNDKVNLPRKVRRRLRAIAHHLRTGKPASLTVQQLAGWQALQKMISQRAAQIPAPIVKKK